MKVAVIGAGGHVGSAIVEKLEQHPELQVVAVLRNGLTARILNPPRADVRVGSLFEPDQARRLLGDCDVVINCALPVGANRDARKANRAIVGNMARLSNAAVVVHFSTIAVYGSRISAAITGPTPRPETPHGAAKLALERYARRVLPAEGRRHYILRLGHVYGAGQWVSREIFANACRGGFALPFDGRTPSNTVWVRTVAAAMHRLLSERPPSGTYDLTDKDNRSWRELYDLHTAALNAPPVPALDDEQSRFLRDQIAAHNRVAHLIPRALQRSVGAGRSSFVLGSPELRHIADSWLAILPDWVELRVRNVYLRARVRADLAWLAPAVPVLSPWLFSSAVPGPLLPVAESGAFDARDQDLFTRDVRAWYSEASTDQWAARILAR